MLVLAFTAAGAGRCVGAAAEGFTGAADLAGAGAAGFAGADVTGFAGVGAGGFGDLVVAGVGFAFEIDAFAGGFVGALGAALAALFGTALETGLGAFLGAGPDADLLADLPAAPGFGRATAFADGFAGAGFFGAGFFGAGFAVAFAGAALAPLFDEVPETFLTGFFTGKSLFVPCVPSVFLCWARPASGPVSEKARSLTEAKRGSKACRPQKPVIPSQSVPRRFEGLAYAGPAYADAGIGIEEGSVGCTLEVVPVHGEECAWHPIEFDAAVRALVNEQFCRAVTAQRDQAPPVDEIDPFAGALRERVRYFKTIQCDGLLGDFHGGVPGAAWEVLRLHWQSQSRIRYIST